MSLGLESASGASTIPPPLAWVIGGRLFGTLLIFEGRDCPIFFWLRASSSPLLLLIFLFEFLLLTRRRFDMFETLHEEGEPD